jgi:hypothetical protein
MVTIHASPQEAAEARKAVVAFFVQHLQVSR